MIGRHVDPLSLYAYSKSAECRVRISRTMVGGCPNPCCQLSYELYLTPPRWLHTLTCRRLSLKAPLIKLPSQEFSFEPKKGFSILKGGKTKQRDNPRGTRPIKLVVRVLRTLHTKSDF